MSANCFLQISTHWTVMCSKLTNCPIAPRLANVCGASWGQYLTCFTEKLHLLHVVFEFVQNITNTLTPYWLYLIIIILKKKWSSGAMWSLPVSNKAWVAPHCFWKWSIVEQCYCPATNSSQSDNLQVKSHFLVKQTDWCYKLDYPKPLIGILLKTPTP